MTAPLPPGDERGHDAAPLVGRARERALLEARLAATLAGQGSLVLVDGEAGIGKTALAEVVCAEAAARGAPLLVGRCYDLSETPPYGPWREVFAGAPRDAALSAPPVAWTVETHVSHTLAKLGLTARSQIATWATSHHQ